MTAKRDWTKRIDGDLHVELLGEKVLHSAMLTVAEAAPREDVPVILQCLGLMPYDAAIWKRAE